MRVDFLLHVVDRFDDLDAAGLAAAAGVNLRLHDPDGPAKFLGALDASSTLKAGTPRGTGTPNSRNTAFA